MTHAPGAFLDLPPPASDPDRARVAVLPLPYEATVSYGGGTANGPAAILEASRQVELYDRRRRAEPALAYGIHTLPAPAFAAGEPVEQALARVERAARDAAAGHFLLALGGEHSLTPPLFSGVAQALGGSFTVVHLDAHADLRAAYDDTPHSHACALRRVAEHPACEQILQFGIRSLCAEEADFIDANPECVRTWFREDVPDAGWRAELAERVRGKRVYFTFDVDALDPAVVPATGTPEPDGLSFNDVLSIAGLVADAAGEVVAMDCVELAPSPGLHYADFAVAKLLYGLLNLFVDRA